MRRENNSKRGYVLPDCLSAVLVSSFIGAVLIGAFATVLTCREFVADVLAAWVKSERIFLVIESRVVNAGLDVSPRVFMEDSAYLLPDWENALEILNSSDDRVPFVANADGEEIARGDRMRVLSASIAVTNYLISSDGWAPGASINFPVPLYSPNFLEWWWTMPSLGVPFRVQPDKTIVNPSSKTWRGVDLPHTFRIAYFHAERHQGEDVFYIRDSTQRDTLPTAPMHKEPIMNGITAASFELNKTKKTLTARVSIATSKRTREISRTWEIRNLQEFDSLAIR